MRSATRLQLRWLATIVAAVVLSTLSAVGLAQTGTPRIGYVDTQRIIRESELFTVGRERLTDEFTARTQVLELEEARLRELEARRDREIAALTSQESAEIKREIDTLDRSIQRRRNDMKQAMNRRINELSEIIDQRIQEEIGAYAREQGFDLVLTDGVGFAHPRLDITDAILARVNAHAAELRGP